MSYELIITEKPAAAAKVAEALAEGKPIKENNSGVAYYLITRKNKDIVVACAVGHLFTVAEKEKSEFKYPVFSVDWKATSETNSSAAFTKKYLTTIKKLAKDANEFTIATDYDIEGEVIGFNILKYVCKQKDGNRMKFSTLTKEDLVKAYDNKKKTINWGQANAGLTRHELDWYYGINLSRALTSSIKSIGSFKIMSAGRVQGPALKIIVQREKEIQAFKPVPFWQVEMLGDVPAGNIKAWHKEDKIFDKRRAEEIVSKTTNKIAKIDDIKNKSFKQTPPTPFDLTTLQTESYRCFGISPKETLQIAQELYTGGLISYPRTSSQKLPEKLGFKAILKALSKDEQYKILAGEVLKTKLKPNEGKKLDPAHPAIYPTGALGNISGREAKLFDLIVKRFFATFGSHATRETVTIDINCEAEHFLSKGTRTTDPGWHNLYRPYVKLEEEELPSCQKGDKIEVKEINLHAKETQPPKRYTQASIIKELEKRNLGTKSTRASIVDTLYQRNYVIDKAIKATDLGIKTTDVLDKYLPSILDEKLTTHFEEEMELIREDKKENKAVLKEAVKILTESLGDFKTKEKEVGKELLVSFRATQDTVNTIGKCQNCETGFIMIRKGKFGRFAACNNYPDCKTTFNMPKTGNIKVTKSLCTHCNYPIINIIQQRKQPLALCINPDCPGKLENNSVDKEESDEGIKKEKIKIPEKIDKKCPKCNSDLSIRSSIYGKFIGCTNYPKCKYTEKIGGSETNNDLL